LNEEMEQDCGTASLAGGMFFSVSPLDYMPRDHGSEWSGRREARGKTDELLACDGRLIRLDSQKIVLCGNLRKQVGANLEYTWDPLPHGVGQSVGMAPN